MRRREFVTAGAAAAGALAFGPTFWRQAFEAQGARAGVSPYGPLQPPDLNGLMLPKGFRSREIARAGAPVAGYPWHVFPDGQATFATRDGGWILVSNSESPAGRTGGASAIRFARDGRIVDAYRILAGTNANCAGGPTPWGTWLSGEEYDGGLIWECDPTGSRPGVPRPALGTFNHEAAAVDPVRKRLYLTEDESDGGFYRFTPESYPNLTRGLLEVAVVNGSKVSWARVPDPSAVVTPTRKQVARMTKFRGGEGIWYDSDTVYFTTKGDNRVWAYDARRRRIEVIYDLKKTANGPLKGVDNVTVSSSGDVYVCEDGGNLEICIITPDRVVAPFLRLTGPQHEGLAGSDATSELAGVVFDPSGKRMYCSSQRGFGLGVTYEVTGPFDVVPGRVGAPIGRPPRTRRDDPGIHVTTRRRVGYHRLRARGGLPIRVKVDEPGMVAISLTSADLDTVPGERGSTRRPRHVRLGRYRRRFRRKGARKVIVKLNRRAIRKLRRRGKRSVVVRVTAQVRDRDGNVGVTSRRLRVDLRRRG